MNHEDNMYIEIDAIFVSKLWNYEPFKNTNQVDNFRSLIESYSFLPSNYYIKKSHLSDGGVYAVK